MSEVTNIPKIGPLAPAPAPKPETSLAPEPLLPPQLAALLARCDVRREHLERLLKMDHEMRLIVARLPDGLHNVCVTDDTIQISDASREQVLAVLSALQAGKWEKEVCHANGEKLNYETKINGVRVLLFYADPPTSCRIETEEIDIPARKEIMRRLICK